MDKGVGEDPAGVRADFEFPAWAGASQMYPHESGARIVTGLVRRMISQCGNVEFELRMELGGKRCIVLGKLTTSLGPGFLIYKMGLKVLPTVCVAVNI